MPKKARERSPLEVRHMTSPGLHPVGGVPGLLLQVTRPRPSEPDAEYGSRSWVLRTTVGGRRRDIGLGGFPEVSLGDAREAAREIRKKARRGVDPIAERQAAQDALKAAQAARITFDECAQRYLAAKRHEFRNAKHARQWGRTLELYASPVIGSMPVAEIGLAHVLEVLEPIWFTKTESASRIRGRMENVLAWATTSGYRSGENPARWRGHLDTVLPAPSKVAKVAHHRALPFTEVGAFMQRLRQREGMAARALEFLVLTATRSGEVRHATWDEIGLEERIWTIPGDRVKSGREHRIPISDDALKILQAVPRHESSPYVFPAPRGGALSDATLSAVLRRMKVDAVPHGFRSSFRDWAAEQTAYPHEVVEAALAHAIPDKVERAYRRGDLFRKRARLMRDWARYCALVQSGGGNVLALSGTDA